MSFTKLRHFDYQDLEEFLQNQHRLPENVSRSFKEHLDNCRSCWDVWNKVRWDAAMDSKGMRELQKYLGSNFKPYFDSSWAIAEDWLEAQPKNEREIANFYKNTPHYLYNLIVWYESRDRIDFKGDFQTMKNVFNLNSVIDYGCGVGNDGLHLIDRGWKVFFIDHNCPSAHFLRWRLEERKLSAPIFDVERIEELPAADMLLAVDVLEHMSDPTWVVRRLHNDTKLFVHRSKFSLTSGGRHPCHLPFDEYNLQHELKHLGFEHIPWPRFSVWHRR